MVAACGGRRRLSPRCRTEPLNLPPPQGLTIDRINRLYLHAMKKHRAIYDRPPRGERALDRRPAATRRRGRCGRRRSDPVAAHRGQCAPGRPMRHSCQAPPRHSRRRVFRKRLAPWLLLAVLWQAAAAPAAPPQRDPGQAPAAPRLLPAEQEAAAAAPRRAAAEVLLPGARRAEGREPMCMMVCAGWEQRCVRTNHARGVISEKCRRTCASFVEECF